MTGVELVGVSGITIGVRIIISALRQAGLPGRYAPLAAVLLGALAGQVGAYFAGTDWYTGLLLGVLAGGAAVGLYEIGHQVTKQRTDEVL